MNIPSLLLCLDLLTFSTPANCHLPFPASLPPVLSTLGIGEELLLSPWQLPLELCRKPEHLSPGF